MDGIELAHTVEKSTDVECEGVNIEQNMVGQCVNADTSSGVVGGDTCDSTKPFLGMVFKIDDEAFRFYNSYALRTEFGVRKGPSCYSRKKYDEEQIMIGRTFVRDKEGKKQSSGMDDNTCKRELRAGCGARMRISLTKDNTWKISKFVEMHSGHELTSPDKAMKHRSHMKLHRSKQAVDLMDRLRDEGLPPSTISKVVNVANGSSETIITPQHCTDHLRKRSDSNIGNECSAIINQFANKKLTDLDFYFAMELDENRTMRSVFWADGRSRSSYLRFGDVLVFDVTHRTNKLYLPFAPFTGVNHHRQSILFGTVLLADEEEAIFVWLFTEWLKCMHGQPPTSIITDQDIAIGNAIKKVFPTSRHRYCSWHIGKHVVEQLPKLWSMYGKDIGTYLNKWRCSRTIEQAEQHWREIKEKFQVDENANTWLPVMYRKRHHWIETYLDDTFWAGMKSTLRSESINAFFDGYVNSQTQLHEFVNCYDRLLLQRRAAELHEDFMTLNSKLPMENCHAIEVQAAKLYTRSVFKLFQQEMRGIYQVIRREEKVDGAITTYRFGHVDENKNGRYEVRYEAQTRGGRCSCALFETTGILCRHILNIMCNVHQLQAISEQYILLRWRIDARRRSIADLMHGRKDTCGQGNSLEIIAARTEFNEVLLMSSGSGELIIELRAVVSKFATEWELLPKQIPSASQVASNTTVQELSAHVTVRDPSVPVVTKGQPRGATRVKSGLEERIEKSNKKQRTCQNCFQKRHYRTSCKNSPAWSLPCNQESEEDEDDDEECPTA